MSEDVKCEHCGAAVGEYHHDGCQNIWWPHNSVFIRQSDKEKVVPEIEREIEAVVHLFGDAIRRDGFDPDVVAAKLHDHLIGLVKEGRLTNRARAPRTDRPGVAEVERLAENWVTAQCAYETAVDNSEDEDRLAFFLDAVSAARTAFLTAFRALGDAEWDAAIEAAAKAAEDCGNFGDYRRDELTADYGQPKFDMMHAIIKSIRALRRTPAGR